MVRYDTSILCFPPAPLEERVEGMLRLPWEEARGLFPDLERVTEMKPDGARAWCVFWGPTMRKNFRSGLVVALREAAVSAGLAAAPAAAVPGAAPPKRQRAAAAAPAAAPAKRRRAAAPKAGEKKSAAAKPAAKK